MPLKSVPFGRIIANTAAILAMVFGFVILICFSGAVYVEPQFAAKEEILKGAALLCLLGGSGALMLNVQTTNPNDLRAPLALSLAGAVIGALMVFHGVMMVYHPH